MNTVAGNIASGKAKGKVIRHKAMNEYRIETTHGRIIAATNCRNEAVRLCKASSVNAFIWSMSAEMIVGRNY